MGLNGTRNFGTLLMGIGLLLVISVGGYFAWNEVQAAQVRSELEQGSAAAAARAARIAQELGRATPSAASMVRRAAPSSAPLALAGKGSATSTSTASISTPTLAPASKASAARSAAAAALATPPATVTTTPAPVAAPTVMPARLAIPDLKIDTPVLEMGWDVVQTKSGPVSEWAIPKNAAGHHINSASIGQPDNLVISGHNNIYGKVFMPISQVWSNDGRVKVDNYTDRSHVLDGREVFLYDAAGNQYKYVITEFYRLKDTGVSQQQREVNGRFIQPTGDERVTIITCWPPTNNTHRLVLIARPEQ